jgi:hypothetical protein
MNSRLAPGARCQFLFVSSKQTVLLEGSIHRDVRSRDGRVPLGEDDVCSGQQTVGNDTDHDGRRVELADLGRGLQSKDPQVALGVLLGVDTTGLELRVGLAGVLDLVALVLGLGERLLQLEGGTASENGCSQGTGDTGTEHENRGVLACQKHGACRLEGDSVGDELHYCSLDFALRTQAQEYGVDLGLRHRGHLLLPLIPGIDPFQGFSLVDGQRLVLQVLGVG